MGAWAYQQVKVFNRTTGTKTERNLSARWDGQEMTLPPGESFLPKHVVHYAKNQNPIMGSEDDIDPSSFESLIGIVGKDDCSPVETDPKQLSRVDIQRLILPGDQVLVRGTVKPRAADAAIRMGRPGTLHEEP